MRLQIVILVALIIGILGANEDRYILSDDGLLDPRAKEKILQIGAEAKEKLGVNLYLNIQEDNGINRATPREERIQQMRQQEANLIKDLKKPYAVLSIVIEQTHTNILLSDELQTIIDKDDILSSYVIPLLASKDKNTLFAKTSAAALNGFAQMGDSVAASKNISLESSIGSQGKVASTIWKMFMYTIVLTGIVLYAIIIMRERKYKKQREKNGNN